MDGRLDAEKLAQLRTWAESLLLDDREELRAAGRGILLLADEVERLWQTSHAAFARDTSSALAERLGTTPDD